MPDTRTVQHGRTHINRQHSASECTLPGYITYAGKNERNLANNPQVPGVIQKRFLITFNFVNLTIAIHNNIN